MLSSTFQPLPPIIHLICVSIDSNEYSIPIQLILYNPPDPRRLRFLTLHPVLISGEKSPYPVRTTEMGNDLGRQDGYSFGCGWKGKEDDIEMIIPLVSILER